MFRHPTLSTLSPGDVLLSHAEVRWQEAFSSSSWDRWAKTEGPWALEKGVLQTTSLPAAKIDTLLRSLGRQQCPYTVLTTVTWHSYL